MPDGKHAAIEPVQPSRAHGSMNSRLRITERPRQLTNRHDTMLSLGKIRKLHMSSRKVFRPFLPHSE